MTAATKAGRSMGLPGRLLLLLALTVGIGLARSDIFTLLFFSPYAAVGALLAIRRPRNSIGWLLIAISFGFIAVTAVPAVDAAALRAGTAAWGDFLIVWASSWAAYATFGSFFALMLLFPSGTLGTGRWRRAAILALGLSVVITVVAAVAPVVSFNPEGGVATIAIPNRFAVAPDLPIWDVVPIDALIGPTIALLAGGVVSLVVRYRRAVGVVQLQLRWFVAALAFMVVAIVAGLSSILVLGEGIGGLAWLGTIVAYPLVPAAIYVAITRYRLYEIDRIISRTIGWALVTAALALVFAGTIVGLQALLAPFTNNNTLAVAGSTLIAAALFQPLRARVQRAVDRRFNRARVDAQRATETFGAHVRDSVDLTVLDERLLAAIDDALQPSRSATWIRGVR